MCVTTVDVSRAVRAGTIISALALVGVLAGCAPRVKPGAPLPGLRRSERARFDRGKEVFLRQFTPETGLGPLFNSTSCGECHEEPATGGFGDEMEVHATALLARSSGRGPHGAGQPDDACDMLADQGGPVLQQHVTPALKAALGIDEEPVPSRATATARRTSPSLLGLGLLDAVPDQTILSYADPDDRDHDGISGRPNHFMDGRIGRFGRKAFVPSLKEFTAGAFQIEQGITSPAQPDEGTIGDKPIPPGVDPTPEPELSQEDLDLAIDFMRFLAPPAGKRDRDAHEGREIFARIGCASCHLPALKTGRSDVRALSNKKVAAYTDLLLHDMGPDLADICFGLATPSEFRTEPLMGLGLRTRFLHDGRASTIEDAVRLHAGEATGARDRFGALSDEERRALLKFLASL